MKRNDILGIAFSLICLGFCIFGFSKIQSNTEDVLQWLPDQSEARSKYDMFETRFGSDDFLIATWDGCTIEDPRLKLFGDYLRDNDPDELFQLITDGADVYARLSQLDLSRATIQRRLRGVFFGAQDPNLTAVMLELSAEGSANRTASMQAIWKAIEAVPDLEREQVSLGGYPYIATFIDEQLKDSFRYFLIPSVVISTLIALFCLRNIALTLIVFVTAVGAAATSIAFIPICETKYGGLMSIIPALVFVLAISGSIHLIRYGLDVIGDSKKLLKIGWRPCFVSAATTSVGMLSLMRSDFPAIRNFGLFCATGVGFALMFQLILVPWLLERFGSKGLQKLANRSEKAHFWKWLVGRVQAQHLLITVFFGILMILGVIGLTKLTAEVEVEKLFRPNSSILKSIAEMESRLGPMDQTELLVTFEDDGSESFREGFPLRARLVRGIQNSVSKVDSVDVIYSLNNFFPNEPVKTNARSMFKRSTYRNILLRERENLANGSMLYLDDKSETWRISLRFDFTKKQDFDRIKSDVVQASTQVVQPIDLSVGTISRPGLIYTGKTHLFHHAQMNLLSDLYQNFLLAFVIITPMLIIVLRSFALGLIAMLPNVFPTLIVFGGLGWASNPVDLAIAMTACVALGIAVDDTTHFLIRFRDHGGGLRNISSPIVKTIAQCGPAMLHTTLIGGAGLAVYYFSSMLVVARFSWSIATLLVIALIADVVMLPAILFLLGRDAEPDQINGE